MTHPHPSPERTREPEPALARPRSAPPGRVPGRVRRGFPRRYLVALALVAVVAAVVLPRVLPSQTNTSAKDRIEADPPPTLFSASAVARIDELSEPQVSSAHQLMGSWWTAHGTQADDAAFAAWLEQTFPPPPSASKRATELAEVEGLDAQRTEAGVAAATWLEAFGKKDVWKLEVHDQAELLPSATGETRKNTVDDLLSMSKHIADTLGARFQQSAPYVLEPSLRTDHTVTDGQVCPCSYPSRHASSAAASRTFLGQLMPQRDVEYRWWQDQIDYSRLYMAGHVASDISGGTLLGDMIGEYFLVTREGLSPTAVP